MKRPDVEGIWKRAIKATRGPWQQDDDAFVFSGYLNEHRNHPDRIVCDTDQLRPNASADMDFIASARSDVPALCAYIQYLERKDQK